MSRHLLKRVGAASVLTLLTCITLAAQAGERVLYVSVFDQKTREPITGLGTRDIVVREDGAEREVLRVVPATTPMPIAVIVDNSQAADETIPDVRKALTAFMRAVDGLGPVAIITVGDRPTVVRDYTADPKLLLDAAGRIFTAPQSGATLLDAIVETSRGLEKRESDRAALVIVTTENVEHSTRHERDVVDAVRKAGAMMHALVLTGRGSSRLDDASRNRAAVLDRGPRQTGGVRFDVVTSMGFEGRLQEIARIMKSQHQVTYGRPQRLIPPEKIEVTAAKAGLAASGLPARGQAIR
jgi:VWFA-related protein